ncbi:unnamed protein product [Caretta caretta]
MKDTIFATLNTRGCSVVLRRSQVLSFLREGGYSVIFLQETHTAPAVEASSWLEWGDEIYFSHLGAHSAGVVFSSELRPEVLGVAEVVPGHLLHFRACVEGLRLNLVSVYAPNAGPEQVRFYRQASAFLGTLDPHECLVLGGDFNTTLKERDRSGVETSQAAVGVLREIVDHHSLEDVCRDHHPDDDVTFTYVRRGRGRPIGILIRACWRMWAFVASFWEFWLAWWGQRHAFPSARRSWDVGKVRAWLFCRDYTWCTTWWRDVVIGQLEREVLELERRLASGPEDPPPPPAVYREKREKLRALEDHRAQGAFVRSRIRLLREMDHGSRFYALEKRRGAKKHVTCLLVEDGTPLIDPEEMCGRARAFYANLFSPNPTDADARRVLWTELPMVSAGNRDWLELPLSLAELSEALYRMPTNKSPGMDGLTVEFYRVFWDVLGLDLIIVWADTDYKVIVKAISLRLGSVLADVVHPDQTYTVPGRTIFDNLYLVRDLFELERKDGLSFTLLSLDQEKTLDRVLYADAECLVRLNWTLTEPVSFGRGVRQGCPLLGQLYTLVIEPFLRLLRWRLTGLALREPELRLVLSAYANNMLLLVQDLDDLVWVEACQAIYSVASTAWINWVKSSGLVVGDRWQTSSLPPVLQAIRWSAGLPLYLGIYLSTTHPSPPENWQDLEARVGERLRRWTGLFRCLSL